MRKKDKTLKKYGFCCGCLFKIKEVFETRFINDNEKCFELFNNVCETCIKCFNCKNNETKIFNHLSGCDDCWKIQSKKISLLFDNEIFSKKIDLFESNKIFLPHKKCDICEKEKYNYLEINIGRKLICFYCFGASI